MPFSTLSVPSGFAVIRVTQPFSTISITRLSLLMSHTLFPLKLRTVSIRLTSFYQSVHCSPNGVHCEYKKQRASKPAGFDNIFFNYVRSSCKPVPRKLTSLSIPFLIQPTSSNLIFAASGETLNSRAILVTIE